MNARQLYLGWLRTTAPLVYARALRTATNPNANLAGLGDDLTSPLQSVTVDTGDSSLSATDIQAISDAGGSSDTGSGNSWADFFSSVANAVGTIAPAVVQTQAQQNLLAINTQRARQGLAPLTASGVPVTANMLAPTSATLASIEASMAGGSGTLLLVGGGILLAVLLLMKKRAA